MEARSGPAMLAFAPAAADETARRLAFATVLVAFVLEVADSTIVNTALPAIRASLHANAAAMQWVVAAYFLSLGSLLLIGGRLGDMFGYRRMFLVGIAAFVAASMLCGFAQAPEQLVAARLLQGAAGAVMGPQVMAIVQLLFDPLERVQRLAWFGVLGGIAAILGPIVGGLLIEANIFGLGWRTIFFINLPLGLLALVAGQRFIPVLRSSHPVRVDAVGALLFGGGFGAILLSLIQGPELGWPAAMWLLLAVGCTLVASGWRHAKRRHARIGSALIEPTLFRITSFSYGLLAVVSFSSASAGFLLVFAVSLQQGLGLSALETALIHVPFGLGVMAGISLIGRRFLPVLGKWVMVAGAASMALWVVLAMLLISEGTGTDLRLLAVLTLAGVSMGMLAGPLPPVIVAGVDRAHAGIASATMKTAQQLGSALGVAIVGAAYFAAGANTPAARLVGLRPAAAVISTLLALALVAALRLPRDIFGRREIQA